MAVPLMELILSRPHLPFILTDVDLAALLGGSDHRRYGIVKRALAKKHLIQIRRGLYAVGEIYRPVSVHAFNLAQRIYGPSCVSFESALAHYGLIPEAVYTTTSGTCRRSADFDTPFGRFSYVRIPGQPFYTAVHREEVDRQGNIFFIASPLRALCDYIYASRQEWSVRSLEESLRLEIMPRAERDEFNQIREFHTNHRVQGFLKDYQRRMYE